MQIAFGKSSIACEVRRSKRRTIAVTVNPDATVTVTAPSGAADAAVAEAVRGKAAWIVKHQDWLRRHYPPRPREFVSGETFLYLGRQYHLRVVRDGEDAPRVTLTQGTFRVALRNGVDRRGQAKQVRTLLVEWYRRHALDRLGDIAMCLGGRLGVGYESLRLLDMPTRWGSGGPNRRLRFNWRIIMAPKRLVEYVVAHELCHVRHARHTPQFWRLLARVMPDYEQRRQQLATCGPAFDL